MMVPPRVAQQDESKQALECGAISHVISVTSLAGDVVAVPLSCRNYECNEERSRAMLPVRCISLRNQGAEGRKGKRDVGALIIDVGWLAIGTGLLLVGADWFLDGAGDLVRSLGVSALVLGVLLAGLEPEEMLTAAIASARDAPTLAVGNVIGTNITIVTAALGLSALIFPMVIDRSVRRQALLATLVSIIPIVLLFVGVVTQLAGVLLLAVFVGYTLFLFRTDREAVKRMAESEADDDDDDDDDDEDQKSQARPRLHWKPV